MSFKEVKYYQFISNKWQHPTATSNTLENSTTIESKSKYKIATLNVLTDHFSMPNGFLLRPKERFRHIVDKEIPGQNADIFCCNEVTPTFLQLVMDNQLVRDNYALTEVVDKSSSRPFVVPGSMGNLVLIKLKLLSTFQLRLYRVELSKLLRAVPCCILEQKGNEAANARHVLTVSAVHLTAYEHLVHYRAEQFTALHKSIDSIKQELYGSCQSVIHHSTIILGDMNVHSVKEKFWKSTEFDYVDMWTATRGNKEAGFTFDSLKNHFIKYYITPFERRRMRLDRIMVLNSSHVAPVSKVSIFADQPVYPTRFWDYLYCSDHYGLAMEFELLEGGREKQRQVDLGAMEREGKSSGEEASYPVYATRITLKWATLWVVFIALLFLLYKFYFCPKVNAVK